MAGYLSIESADGITVVRIDRSPANAMSPGLLIEAAEVVERLRADAPAAVVITGTGRFFSAGVDLKVAPTLSVSQQGEMVVGINRMFCDWYDLPCPLIAAVNGHAVAGGMILALAADYRVGSRAATYGITELQVGAPFPAAAIAVIAAELAPGAARRLLLRADLVDAETALSLGLVDELAEPAAVFERSFELAREFAALPAQTYAEVKQQLRGPTVAEMREASARDPLAAGWFSDETPDAARGVLERER